MADFLFTILANSNTNVLRVNMYEATAANSVVATQDLTPPFSTSQQITFTNLNDATHIVRVYEVVSSVQGALLAQQLVYPTPNTITQDKVIEIVGGTDMVANQDTYDGSLAYPNYVGLVAGVDYYISRRGTGILKSDEFQDLGSGLFGFKLLNGNVFNDTETFHIHFYAKLSITASTNNTVVAKWKDIKNITLNTTLNNTHIGCIMSVNSSVDDATEITLDIASNVPDMSPFKIINQLGLQQNVIVKTPAGMNFVYANVDSSPVDTLYLGKCRGIELIKQDNLYWVIDEDDTEAMVGKQIYSYSVLLNTVEANGQLLSRTKYARFWNWIQQTQTIYSDSIWNTDSEKKKANFSDGDGSTTFRVPDLRDQFIRGKSSARSIGSWQDSENKKHGHGIRSTNSDNSNNDGADVVRGNLGGSISTRGGEDNIGGNNKTIASSGGDESRPVNTALLTLICV